MYLLGHGHGEPRLTVVSTSSTSEFAASLIMVWTRMSESDPLRPASEIKAICLMLRLWKGDGQRLRSCEMCVRQHHIRAYLAHLQSRKNNGRKSHQDESCQE